MKSKLSSGSKIGIIGGGPAGSFMALYLLFYAKRCNISLVIHIYEPRDFSEAGPHGCNQCAGILSSSLIRNIKELEIDIPSTVIQSRITSYRLLSSFGEMVVHNPESGEIFSIFRGGGPLKHPLGVQASFDDFLLEEAKKRGAATIKENVDGYQTKPEPAILVKDNLITYDLVVLAAGVNSGKIKAAGSKYRPPLTQLMSQDELYVPNQDGQMLGSTVPAFLFPDPEFVFGTMVPKGKFINISLLSRGKRPVKISTFLQEEPVKKILSFGYERSCGCSPRISVKEAQNFYDNNFVAVGDAAVTRLYKDGIGSALLTARQASHTAILHGVSRKDFRKYYFPLCLSLIIDNRIGWFIFSLHEKLKRSPAFFSAYSDLISEEWREKGKYYPFSLILWGMFTGSYSYRKILLTALSPVVFFRLLYHIFFRSKKTVSVQRNKPRVLILGGGFGGIYSTLHLNHKLKDEIQITLVSDENFFLFTPFLHEVATGGVETRHIANPIRRIRGKEGFEFLQARVDSIDLSNRKVMTNTGEISYDFLIMALGSTSDTPKFAEGKKNTYTLKSLRDGMLIRNHIIRTMELAERSSKSEQRSLLTFIVTGGGYTGIQLVAEVHDFIVRSLIKNYTQVNLDILRIIMVHNNEYLLPGMDTKMAKIAQEVLLKKEIELRLNSRVTGVLDDTVEINGKEIIGCRTVLWVAGNKASPVVGNLPVEKDENGRVKVDKYLRVPGYPGVYALGDNANFYDEKTGQPLPAKAHFAVRQPNVLADNIRAEIKGGKLRPFAYTLKAEMVSLGSHNAVINIHGIYLRGLTARAIWLIGYLMVMKGAYNRTRVLIDWILNLIFGRDSTLLDIR